MGKGHGQSPRLGTMAKGHTQGSSLEVTVAHAAAGLGVQEQVVGAGLDPVALQFRQDPRPGRAETARFRSSPRT